MNKATAKRVGWIWRLALMAMAGGAVLAQAQDHAQKSLPKVAKDARQTATQVCAACHGADGNSIRTDIPSLAQQGAGYLDDQLQQFAAQGQRRASGVMGAMALNLTPEERAGLAAYFSYQALVPSMPTDAPATKRGESIYFNGLAKRNVAACASCHGWHGEGLAPSFPRLAGQHALYVANQLRQFRSGQRASDSDALMRTVSARLSDADIDAVARYVAAFR